jgi:hypothetical protein
LDHFGSMDAIGSLRSPAPVHPNPLGAGMHANGPRKTDDAVGGV